MDGNHLLKGPVITGEYEKEAAEDDAWFTAGVSGIENELIIETQD